MFQYENSNFAIDKIILINKYNSSQFFWEKREYLGISYKGENMNLKDYFGFFHDGTIINIIQNNDYIEILMESAEILPEWNKENISLSNRATIKGKLHLEQIKNILIDKKPVNHIQLLYDDGEILTFRINNNKLNLLVLWSNYPPKLRLNVTQLIEIEAEKIYWENIPNLFSPIDFPEAIQ